MTDFLAPGVHRISADRYHADRLSPRPTLSSTLARLLLNQSPRHAWTASPRLNPDHEPENKKAFDIGRAAHREVLGAGGDYAAIPADMLSSNGAASTKEAKAFIEECRAAGVTPVKEEEADEVRAMAEACRARLAALKILLDPGRSEITALAEIDGVWCRAMVDNAPARGGRLIDFKTTTDAHPDACIRAVVNYGYDVQAAHYLDCWEAATGERREFLFVFQEKAPPYEVSVVKLHDDPQDPADWMLDARSKVAEARRIWGECLSSGVWPGYPPAIAVVGAPSFHRTRWADREIGKPVVTEAALRLARQFQAP